MKPLIYTALAVLFLSLHLTFLDFPTAIFLFYAAFLALAVMVVFSKKRLPDYNTSTRAYSFLFLVPFIFHCIHGNIFGTYRLYFYLACWLAVFIFVRLFSKNKSAVKVGFFIIVFSAFFETVLGFGQMFGWIPNSDANFVFGGSFGNGFGAVEANYGKWQAAYFEKNGGTKAEIRVADYVTCAYNETSTFQLSTRDSERSRRFRRGFIYLLVRVVEDLKFG
jgi:hypothetical protein